MTILDFVSRLQKRADWLKSEYLNGGNYEHLKAREDECRYIADLLTQLERSPSAIAADLRTQAAASKLGECLPAGRFPAGVSKHNALIWAAELVEQHLLADIENVIDGLAIAIAETPAADQPVMPPSLDTLIQRLEEACGNGSECKCTLQDAIRALKEPLDTDWRQSAAAWLRGKAEEQEKTNAQYPRHAAAYQSWRDRPQLLLFLAASVLGECIEVPLADVPKAERTVAARCVIVEKFTDGDVALTLKVAAKDMVEIQPDFNAVKGITFEIRPTV